MSGLHRVCGFIDHSEGLRTKLKAVTGSFQVSILNKHNSTSKNVAVRRWLNANDSQLAHAGYLPIAPSVLTTRLGRKAKGIHNKMDARRLVEGVGGCSDIAVQFFIAQSV